MQSAGKLPLIVIAGPTGVGKTALAIALAESLNGEIVSADSRQIYRGMDIGTAKPTAEEQARIPHHLIDVSDPDVMLSLTEYQVLAYAAITDITMRGRLPLLVGGTGQYITAVIEGWRAPEVPPDLTLRAELQAYADEHGSDALYARLSAADPGVIGLIDSRNVRRVIRALEVTLISGQPFSVQRRKDPPPYRTLELALTMDRALLDMRLDQRIEAMLAHGLLDEVRRLSAAGYDWRLPSMSSLGYAQIGAYLRSEIALDEAIADFQSATRAFARRQLVWFRGHGDPRWIDVLQTSQAETLELVRNWLASEAEADDRTSAIGS